jgi:hypothetical protein
MRVEDVISMIDPGRFVIAGSQVFLNTWDEAEAAYWSAQGATVREFYNPNAIRFSDKVKQGWEIILNNACDPVTVTKLTGETEDITSLALVKAAREAKG